MVHVNQSQTNKSGLKHRKKGQDKCKYSEIYGNPNQQINGTNYSIHDPSQFDQKGPIVLSLLEYDGLDGNQHQAGRSWLGGSPQEVAGDRSPRTKCGGPHLPLIGTSNFGCGFHF